MKLKISKKDQKLIRVFKKVIDNDAKKQDKIFAGLVFAMMLTASEEEIIWDYVYNDSSWLIELENK